MKFIKVFVSIMAVIAFSLSIFGCSAKSTPSTSTPPTTQAFQIPSSFTTYSDEASLFSISYPNQWTVSADLASILAKAKDAINNIKTGLPIDSVNILFMSGLQNQTGYLPYVAVVVEPVVSGVSNVDQAANAEMLGLKQVDPKYVEIARTKAVIDGKNAVIIEYTAHFSSTGLLSHNLIMVELSGKTIWSLTCSTTDDIYAQWAGDFNNIVRSMEITG